MTYGFLSQGPEMWNLDILFVVSLKKLSITVGLSVISDAMTPI